VRQSAPKPCKIKDLKIAGCSAILGGTSQREITEMRIFTATLGTETNTFAPMPTGLAEFQGNGYDMPATPSEKLPAFGQLCRALRERSAEAGWTLIEGKLAFAQPSGVTVKSAYELLRDQLLADLKAAMPVDAVLLQIHGAMIAEGYEDAEGDLLARVRALIGPDVFLGAELDLHCHLTEQKVGAVDLMVIFKEYPHTDIYDRARDLVRLSEEALAGKTKPVMHLRDLGFISLIPTTREPASSLIKRFYEMEGKDGVLSISFGHGFPWGDSPDLGARLLVVTDGDAAKAERICKTLGDEIIAMRDKFAPPYPDADGAITRGLGSNHMSVVMADSADNPGAGAGGDSTFILARLLERNVENAVLGPFWDPVAVSFCHQAGVGANLKLRIGGKVSRYSGPPLDVTVEVLAVKKDAWQDALSGTVGPLGDVAVVRIDGVKVVLTTHRTQGFGTNLFEQFGIKLAETKLIVVKSSQHFHAGFGPIASEVVYVDTPGVAPADLRLLQYERAPRTLWPLNT
jgi:microcystin degradation protein MlrC